jgi:Transposase DDE domain
VGCRIDRIRYVDPRAVPAVFRISAERIGRKRHLLVDTLGLVLLVVITAANVQDRQGARTLLTALSTRFRRLRLIWADGAYGGDL